MKMRATAMAVAEAPSAAMAVRGSNCCTDTPDEIVVTVYDMNATPPGPVLLRQTIDGFAWMPALVTPDLDGGGHVRWSAETTGTSFHQCGHAERRGLAN